MMRVQASYEMDVALSDAQLATISASERRSKATRDGKWGCLQRRRLVEIAAESFSRRGYARTSLREIATIAGCHERTIRAVFGGKLALLGEAIRGRIADDQVPREAESSTLEEEIDGLMVWQVNRMRRQRHCLDAFLPQDRFNPLVWQAAGKLSLDGSREILQARLRSCQIDEAEVDFLVSAIQAVGFSLGWNGSADRNQVVAKVKHVARVLAGGLRTCQHFGTRVSSLRQPLPVPPRP
jgi:AcrR family transcriptional regulator